MKRSWSWLWAWVEVLLLLCMLHPCVRLHPHREVAGDGALLGPSEFAFVGGTMELAASPADTQSCPGPLESSAPHLEFWITNDVHLPWPDHRGPPGSRGCHQLLVTGCKETAQAGSAGSDQGTLSAEIPEFRRANSQSGFFNSL